VIIIDEMNDYYSVQKKQSNLSNLQSLYPAPGRLHIYTLSVSTPSPLLTEIFTTHQITHVCHLAARAGVRPSIDDPMIYVESNVGATTTMLEMARKHQVANFVYASSSR